MMKALSTLFTKCSGSLWITQKAFGKCTLEFSLPSPNPGYDQLAAPSHNQPAWLGPIFSTSFSPET